MQGIFEAGSTRLLVVGPSCGTQASHCLKSQHGLCSRRRSGARIRSRSCAGAPVFHGRCYREKRTAPAVRSPPAGTAPSDRTKDKGNRLDTAPSSSSHLPANTATHFEDHLKRLLRLLHRVFKPFNHALHVVIKVTMSNVPLPLNGHANVHTMSNRTACQCQSECMMNSSRRGNDSPS